MSPTDFARQLVKKNDKNGNMMLEADEQSGLRGKEAQADANGDKVITVEEIVAKLADKGGSDRPASSAAGRGTSGEKNASSTSAAGAKNSRVFAGAVSLSSTADKDKVAAASKKRTYRFTPARAVADRLAKLVQIARQEQ